jgi:hypothetical protein
MRKRGLLLLLTVLLARTIASQDGARFAGDWVLRLGTRVILVVKLAPEAEKTGAIGGAILRPEHFETIGSVGFSNIRGAAVPFPIVKSSPNGNCLAVTVRNPANKDDTDDFLVCMTGSGRAELRLDAPGVEPWVLTRETPGPAVATDWVSGRAYFLDDTDVANEEMKRIFDADQADRTGGPDKTDWDAVDKRDHERRAATQKLLAEGKLHTGKDYQRAAFVFQHGGTADEYLLAHTLALVAVARGESSAIWIAAATMDRYLNSIHHPQVYGTQFFYPPNAPVTQEPYQRGLIPDALRRQLGVPGQATQEEQRKQFEAERKGAGQ